MALPCIISEIKRDTNCDFAWISKSKIVILYIPSTYQTPAEKQLQIYSQCLFFTNEPDFRPIRWHK